MPDPTPDEAAARPMSGARLLLLRRLQVPVNDDLAVLDVVDGLLAERDALRADLAQARTREQAVLAKCAELREDGWRTVAREIERTIAAGWPPVLGSATPQEGNNRG